MFSIRKPKARTLGSDFTINTKEDHTHSPVTNDSYDNPFIDKTPGSESGSAFELVSPPMIKRKVRVDGPSTLTSLCTKPLDRTNFKTPERSRAKHGGAMFESPCDTTQATSLHSQTSPLDDERQKNGGPRGKSSSFAEQIKHIKLNLPKALKSMSRSPSKKKSIDLADLAVATICIVPRHGAGIAVGRMPFERMRTSLMLHMVQENQNASWEKKVVEDLDGGGANDGKTQIVKFNTLLRNCVANEESCFVEKTQEAVRLSKETLEELNDVNGKESLVKSELGQRNLTCVKFLTGMYREVISDEKNIPPHDGLSLMVLGGAFYALGKFEPALSVYQIAGIELKKKIASSPDFVIHCAKLFNNMGCVYFEMKKFEKAMKTFQRALQLFHNNGQNNWMSWVSDQASILNNMAYTLIKFKQYDDASDLVDASFELQQILPGSFDKTMTISTLSTMAFIYYRTRKYRLSLDTYSACVQLQDKNPMYNETDQVEVLKKMTDICRKIKDHEKRIYLLRCILVYQQCYLLEDDEEIFETNKALADALQGFADSGGTCI
mmetsp:Transcript_22298/g.54019  ORF Transcript_22298/g.54019 Transcript_22298/m.54019 type:complete len:550 (-) Transcript_22298:181-1830(-)|eukprot:CAMPEP_0181121128 /NCGR_PEP_ID=MMETSP1071-20121207/24560_1 /TAXON_ID=35127 /ORGANISM="Thalassiosira sp., Strain NH16" /LENGTH=549 /DNA_ID=CAMNT_0023205901 /DNA_START=138 /DNA_END=1787 /DNA_ORIENTATION=+